MGKWSRQFRDGLARIVPKPQNEGKNCTEIVLQLILGTKPFSFVTNTK